MMPEPSAPTSAAPISYIQTDTFCDHCGYNLHGQVVTRDERLGILIVRCPECGKFLPAGHTTVAGNVAQHRRSIFLVVVWILFLLYFFGMACMGMGAISYNYIEDAMRVRREGIPSPDGTPSSQDLITNSHDVAAYEREENLRTERRILATISPLIGVVVGAGLAVFLWHLRRRSHFIALLLPFAIGAIVHLMWKLSTPPDPIHWMTAPIALFASLEAIGMFTGILIGRPIVRGILRVLLSPRLLQIMAFLWHVDGKIPPGTAATTPITPAVQP